MLGVKWCGLPKRHGSGSTDDERFRKWRDDGMFETILYRLSLKLREDGLMGFDWMTDSTSVRASHAAAGGGKKGL